MPVFVNRYFVSFREKETIRRLSGGGAGECRVNVPVPLLQCVGAACIIIIGYYAAFRLLLNGGYRMLELLRGAVGEAAAPVIFVVLFLVIVGGALWVTPRLAKWIEKNRKDQPGYFDGMKEEE